MAFENFPQSETTQNETVVKKDNSKTLKIIIGVLAVAMLGTWAYLLFDKNKNQEQLAQKDTTIVTTSTQRDQLQQELEEATMRYDMMKTDNAQKDSSMTLKDSEIAQKQAEIRRLLTKSNATEAELNTARRLIASMNGDIDVYKARVDILEGQKAQLVQEKGIISGQRNAALRNYDSATMVIRKKDNMLDLGSTLQATNFSIIGIDEKAKGKETQTNTAKRVDKLRISFDLAENMIASSGGKELFVCITAPDGSPIAVPALGSGTFVTRDGRTKTYTQKLNVDYTQARKKTVSFDWIQNSNFATGEYKIEVYNNGFKVGDAYKPLKKAGLFG